MTPITDIRFVSPIADFYPCRRSLTLLQCRRSLTLGKTTCGLEHQSTLEPSYVTVGKSSGSTRKLWRPRSASAGNGSSTWRRASPAPRYPSSCGRSRLLESTWQPMITEKQSSGQARLRSILTRSSLPRVRNENDHGPDRHSGRERNGTHRP